MLINNIILIITGQQQQQLKESIMIPKVDLNQCHAEFAPSSFFRLMLCSGAYMLNKFVSEEDSSVAAEEGTMLHKCIETENWENLDLDQEIMIEKCIDVQNKIIDANPNGTVYKEKKLYVFNRDNVLMTFGTVDLVVVSEDGKEATILDWKFGRVTVSDACENWQLFLYALGVHQALGVEKVNVIIFQPRVSWTPSNSTVSDFDSILDTVESTIEKCADTTITEFCAGDGQCRYCKAKSLCHAYKNYSLAQLDEIKNFEIRKETFPAFPDIEIAGFYENLTTAKKQIDTLIKAVDKEMRKRISETGECAGYIVPEYDGKEEIQIDRIYGKVSHIGVEQEDFLGACKVQKGALEKIIKPIVKDQNPSLKALEIKNIIKGMFSSSSELSFTRTTPIPLKKVC